MDNINEIMKLLKIYLKQRTCSKGFLEFSTMNDLIPFLQFGVIFITSIFGVFKYWRTKNKEIYEKRLKEVYAPLYMRLVSQEIYRDILIPNKSVKEVPIIEVKDVKYKNNERYGEKLILERNDFFKVADGINAGLATQELLTLISIYKSLVDLEMSFEKNYTDELFLRVTIKKVKVEYDLYKEIVKGYIKCYKKLGLAKYSNVGEWEIVNDEIKIKYNVTDKEVKTVKADLSNKKGAN